MQRRAVRSGRGSYRQFVRTSGLAQGTATSLDLAERFAATLTAHGMVGLAAPFTEDYQNHQVSAVAPAAAPGLSQRQSTVNFFAACLIGIPGQNVALETVEPASD